MQFVCIGVPYFIGERLPERSEVDAIRTSGFAQQIGAEWLDVVPDFAAAPDAITAVNQALAQAIVTHTGKTPLVFAADCVAALGMRKGLEVHDPAVLWYDAHGDFNTPETTPSGFLGGMPLAWLVGRGDQRYMQGVRAVPVNERDVVLTDARDLDPGEREALHASEVTHLKQVRDLLTAPLPAKPLYIHLDTDVVDPAEMPAMSYPAVGGPPLADVSASLRHVAQTRQVVGILFSLWNDTLPGAAQTCAGTLALARAFVEAAQSRG